MDLLRKLGAASIAALQRTGEMGIFLVKLLIYTFSAKPRIAQVIKQIHFIGYQSTVVILLTGAFAGMVLGLQGYYTLNRFGSAALLGPMVALSLIRELGPVFTALMVTARAGSAMTAEIGIMQATEQVDALKLLGINPYRYLIVPRLIAGVIALPLLTSIFNVIGILGGYLIGVRLLGVGRGIYFSEMAYHVDLTDVLGGIYKSLAFGVLITWICCYKGYHSGFGAEGVSRATTQAVVLSSVLVLFWDYIMTSILF